MKVWPYSEGWPPPTDEQYLAMKKKETTPKLNAKEVNARAEKKLRDAYAPGMVAKKKAKK